MVQSSPRACTRRISRHLHVPHTRVWRTLHAEGIYPYHLQWVQHLGPGDFAERLEFCKLLNGSHKLCRYILFTDEAQFNLDSVNNTRNFHVWVDENHHATRKATFSYVLVSMCGVQFWTISWLVLSSWQVVLQERHTSDFCRRNCPDVWRMCLWILNKRGCMHFQHDRAPPLSSREVSNFLNYRFPGRWMGHDGPHNWPVRSPDLSPLDYCVWGWMKELVYSVKVVTWHALLGHILDAADCIRNSQWKL